MKSMAYRSTPTPVLDLLPSLLTTKTNRPQCDRTPSGHEALGVIKAVGPGQLQPDFVPTAVVQQYPGIGSYDAVRCCRYCFGETDRPSDWISSRLVLREHLCWSGRGLIVAACGSTDKIFLKLMVSMLILLVSLLTSPTRRAGQCQLRYWYQSQRLSRT